MSTPELIHAQLLRRLVEAVAEAVSGPAGPDSPYEAARQAIRHAGTALGQLAENGEPDEVLAALRLAASYLDRIVKSSAAIVAPAIDLESAVTVVAVTKLVLTRVDQTFLPRYNEAGVKIGAGLVYLALGLQGWGLQDADEVASNARTAGGLFLQAIDAV